MSTGNWIGADGVKALDAKLAKPAHHKTLKKYLGIQEHSCPMLQLFHMAMQSRT